MTSVLKYIHYHEWAAFYFSVILALSCLSLIPLEFDLLQMSWLFLIFSVLATKGNPLALTQWISIRRADVLHPEVMAKKLAYLIFGQCLIHAVESMMLFGFFAQWQGIESGLFWSLVFFSLASGSGVLILLLKMLGAVFPRHVQILFLLGMMLPKMFLIMVPYDALVTQQFHFIQMLPLLASLVFDVTISFLALFAVSQWWSP